MLFDLIYYIIVLLISYGTRLTIFKFMNNKTTATILSMIVPLIMFLIWLFISVIMKSKKPETEEGNDKPRNKSIIGRYKNLSFLINMIFTLVLLFGNLFLSVISGSGTRSVDKIKMYLNNI